MKNALTGQGPSGTRSENMSHSGPSPTSPQRLTPSSVWLLLLTFLLVPAAFASVETKTVPQNIVFQDDSLVVWGSRVHHENVPLSDVAGNFSYKSEEDLDKIHPKSFQEAIRDEEGVILFDSVGNGIDTNFSLRGFNQSSAVTFLLDGVRINEVDGNSMVYPLIDMSDLASIQIDRGSHSPIYGSGSFGGVVHLTTAKPSEKPLSIFGGFEYSSFKGIRFNQGVSGTLQDDITPIGGAFQYYFNGSRNLSGGFRRNGEYRITSFNFKTAYLLPENEGKVFLNVKHVDDAVSNPGSIPFEFYQENPEQTLNPLDGRKYKNTIISFGAEKRLLDDKLLASITANWRDSLTHFTSTSITFADCDPGCRRPDTDLITVKSRETDLIWQLLYEDTYKDFLDHKSLIGMEFRDATNLSNEQDATGGHVDPTATRETDRTGKPRSYALFWRETLNFDDKAIAYVGARHSWSSLKTNDRVSPANNFTKKWTDSSWSAGVTFKPMKFTDVYFSYSEGFRAPSISTVNPFNGANGASLKPERLKHYEVGTRVRYKDLARFKFAYFLIDLRDEIVFDSSRVSVNSPFGANANIAESRRTGIEMRLDLQPFNELYLYGSYAWTKAYVRSPGAPTSSLVDGRDLGQIPSRRFTMGAELRPLKRFGENFEGLLFGIYGTHTGFQHPQSYESAGQGLLNSTGTAGHIIKGFSIWDLVVSYAWKKQKVYFKVNNVFDKRYYSRAVNATVSGGAFGSGLLAAGSYTFVNPGAPREFVVGATFEI